MYRSWRGQSKSHNQGTLAPESLRQTGHVEELVEVSKVFSQDMVQQRFGKQTIEIPAESASHIFVTAPVLENYPVVVGSEQPAHVAEYMALAPTVSCTDAAVTHATRPLPATTMAVAHRLVDEKPADDMVSEIRDLKSDLVHFRELLGILVRKERSAEAKAEIAARRLNRMER